ncbi:phosphatase [Modestobacter sp. NPDC049651]|uniref:protein-tyrosine phosphatase family protein n=1 Tax=unclassified Modestobacter TaxID=2643866 RepID=UPI0033DA79EA
MGETWEPGTPGLVTLPSGRTVRGRGLRGRVPPGQLPEFGVYLLGRRPPRVPWERRWVFTADFWVPRDVAGFRSALREAWDRAGAQRVEVACRGGIGRTGTALACLAVMDGVPPDDAVAWVRARYRPRAVETPVQQRFVRGFRA